MGLRCVSELCKCEVERTFATNTSFLVCHRFPTVAVSIGFAVNKEV